MSRKAPKTKWGIDVPRTEKGMQFIAIGKSLYDCDAYKTLPSGAKILLQELMRLCYPNNNGRVGMSQQRAAEFAGVTKKTAGSYLNLLAERGFIVISKYEMWKQRMSREYRVTACSCNGKAPTEDYLDWEEGQNLFGKKRWG